jgi:hypothetical protein
MDHKFYDIHYHLFDLSHPNLTAFILRDDLITRKSVKKILIRLPFLLKIMPVWVVSLFPGKIAERIKEYLKHDASRVLNLLSMIEGAIEYHFLYNEFFLLKEKKHFGHSVNQGYNKIVICPLIIDFGYKGLDKPEYNYYPPPAKPISNQVIDLFNSIYFYYRYDLIISPENTSKFRLVPSREPKEKKLFEIYPFLGLNTRNYDLQGIRDLFEKYFRGYENDITPSDRHDKLYNKMGTIKLDMDEMIFRNKEAEDPSYYSYLFAGIKLYPPLGFDPWPSDNQAELDKVKFLYDECVRLKLPVTVHCSDGGYKTSPEAETYTDPSLRWNEVLFRPEYRKLKINFSHLGSQSGIRTDWRETILRYITDNQFVYTDCSGMTPGINDYEVIRNIMNDKTESGILFGSDFIINLIWSGSYNEYLSNFLQSPFLDDRQKNLICNINPERFLFG